MQRYRVKSIAQVNGLKDEQDKPIRGSARPWLLTLFDERQPKHDIHLGLFVSAVRSDYRWREHAHPAMLKAWFEACTAPVWLDFMANADPLNAAITMQCEGGYPSVEFWRVAFTETLPQTPTHSGEARTWKPQWFDEELPIQLSDSPEAAD